MDESKAASGIAGGGISGLATAYFLEKDAAEAGIAVQMAWIKRELGQEGRAGSKQAPNENK